MAVIHRFAGWLIGQQIILNSVELLCVAPPHATEYLLIYGITPTFQSPAAAVTFDARYLNAPVVRSEDDLIAFIRSSPNDLLYRQDYHPTTSVAQRLSVSAQHLRRRLRDEGTSFRPIKEEILRDEVIASLCVAAKPSRSPRIASAVDGQPAGRIPSHSRCRPHLGVKQLAELVSQSYRNRVPAR